MAVKRASIREVTGARGRASVITWVSLANGDSGEGQVVSRHRDRSFLVSGTMGSGGSVRMEGSNDGGTTWGTLHDPSGTALNITSSSSGEMHAILEAVEQMRPRVTAGDVTTNITVNCFVGGGQ